MHTLHKLRKFYVTRSSSTRSAYIASSADHGASNSHSLILQVVYPYARKQEIIALLEEHITENLVKIGHEYYRQVVGIPQGSVLSAILCSFFYGIWSANGQSSPRIPIAYEPSCPMTKTWAVSLISGQCLMRLIDDWLLVTTDLAKASSFYDMMSEGTPVQPASIRICCSYALARSSRIWVFHIKR